MNSRESAKEAISFQPVDKLMCSRKTHAHSDLIYSLVHLVWKSAQAYPTPTLSFCRVEVAGAAHILRAGAPAGVSRFLIKDFVAVLSGILSPLEHISGLKYPREFLGTWVNWADFPAIKMCQLCVCCSDDTTSRHAPPSRAVLYVSLREIRKGSFRYLPPSNVSNLKRLEARK